MSHFPVLGLLLHKVLSHFDLAHSFLTDSLCHRGASILRLVETRRAREHLSSKFLIAHLDVGSKLWVYYCSKNSSNFNVTSSSESRSCCVSNSNAWHLRWVWVVFWLNEVLHPESSLNVLCVCLILFCHCLILKLDHTEDGLCNVTGWMKSHSSLTELLEMILHMKYIDLVRSWPIYSTATGPCNATMQVEKDVQLRHRHSAYNKQDFFGPSGNPKLCN